MDKKTTSANKGNIKYCEFCKRDGTATKAEYDGKTLFGPWAGMCEIHFRMFGRGLGTGKGQKLI